MLRDKILFFGQKLIERGAWYFAPISWIYALIVFFRNKLYDWRFFRVEKVDAVVVSVGNIVAGGTGKTPFVHMLANRFKHRRVAILSRGYGQFPDEAILLAKRLPNVKVYIGKDRALLAKLAQEELLILDDGFQHRKLHRDFDIVLDKNKKEHYLPWGFLRDQPKRLKGAEVFQTSDLSLKVNRILDKEGREVPSIQGWKVAIFCGIANPQNFKNTVLSLGAEIVSETFYADHEKADLNKLPKVSALVCTEKDFVKLGKSELPIYYLEMEMELVSQAKRLEKLIEIIDQKIDNRSSYGKQCKN
ncbi:MAG: tetraacyldisaccharide 4'-kinase [Chlamydiae bacterium CG10_big_fil_rev_8_21_14_0_10_42_34]|nr:MAG: tetraacyldisaccharide 4'-kinase [Chlamydiae bacterium CG10_big_fil_rev_8_21_14_0_10_42_34]